MKVKVDVTCTSNCENCNREIKSVNGIPEVEAIIVCPDCNYENTVESVTGLVVVAPRKKENQCITLISI